MAQPWMIYGANGYTGKLIAEQAARAGKTPLLAGRSEENISRLAKRLELPHRAFPLEDSKTILRNIADVDLVLHCAGPFSATSRPMVDACLTRGIHYVDITGEINVLEAIFARDAQAKGAGSVLLPGAGFDVVPSDCLAASLAHKVPNALELELAFAGEAKLSPGTLKSMLENLPYGGKVRRNGKIIRVPHAFLSKQIGFLHKSLWVTSIPWGDVSTAFYSTGIPNITVYGTLPRAFTSVGKWLRPLFPLLGFQSLQRILKNQIEKHVTGSTEEELKGRRMYLWGQVKNAKGKVSRAQMEIPEGYLFTAMSSLECVQRILNNEVPPGCWTPSKAFGADFALSFPNTSVSFVE